MIVPVPWPDPGLDGPEGGELLRRLVLHAEGHAETFEALPRRRGIELRRAAPPGGVAGRPRLLLFALEGGRVAAFCYKPSRLAFSHDRFGYGAMVFHRGGGEAAAQEDDMRAVLDFLAADFAPAARPRGLKRALTFTIPED